MRGSTWLWLALLGSACGSTATDTTQSDEIAALQAANESLDEQLGDVTTQLTAATDALAALTARLDDLEAHERLVAAEVIDDGLGAEGVSDDVAGLTEQLGTSRIDALEDGASASCTDVCVTDAELAVVLVDYATDTDVAPLATRVEVEAGDAAERQWVIDQDYLTSADLNGLATVGWVQDQAYATVFYVDTQNALLREWVEDQAFATVSYVDAQDALLQEWVGDQAYLEQTDLVGFATEAWVAAGYPEQASFDALNGRVAGIEADYLRRNDLVGYATETWVSDGFATQSELGALSATVDAHGVTLADHEARISAIEADYVVTAQLAPYASQAALDVALGDIAAAEDDLDALRGAAVLRVTSDLTLTVGPDGFASIQEAYDSLDGWRVDAGATVTIALAAGQAYTLDAPLVLDHPDGCHIVLAGDEAAPDTVVVHAFGGDGLVVPSGGCLGGVRGLTLEGIDQGTGVLVQAGALATIGPALVVRAFDYGVKGRDGALVLATGTTVESTEIAAFHAVQAGTLLLTDVSADGGRYGFAVQDGGVGWVENGTFEGASTGINVFNGSRLWATHVDVTSPTDGFGLSVSDASSAFTLDVSTSGGASGFFTSTASNAYHELARADGASVAGFDTRGASSVYLLNPYVNEAGSATVTDWGSFADNGSHVVMNAPAFFGVSVGNEVQDQSWVFANGGIEGSGGQSNIAQDTVQTDGSFFSLYD